MKVIGAYEAKSRLSEFLDVVEKGEEITITRHGVAIAKLVPIRQSRQRTGQELVEAFRRLRKGCRLNGITIRQLIDEGRR
ncbi:MAG TPA: type II toxin-antitoxin system prevent-host-death family antitoxin [Phycisphaerae bacterium]|nr:type II toxin-antitoxin system prevent-host-death family antitoxin [Phycisphaerae bacterium]